MRTFTKIEAKQEESEPLAIRDLEPRTIFRCEQIWDTEWFIRTNSDKRPATALNTGVLFCGHLDVEVSEVLAPGESLTIGPDSD